jgi:hypothetical protein
MSKIKKAIVAGAGAGAGAIGVYLQSHSFALDADTIGGALVAFVVVGLPVGWATWRAKNAPAV